MAVFPVLTLRTRHRSETSCWVWLGGPDRTRRWVWSLGQLRWRMSEFECVRVDWDGGSHEEMVRAAVAPADPPSWLASNVFRRSSCESRWPSTASG